MNEVDLQVIREAFGRVVYSHKAHEKEADIQECYAAAVKWADIALITIGSGGLAGAAVTSEKALLVIGALFSSVALALAIYRLSFNPEERVEWHKQAANSLWSIRERYIHLLADIKNEAVTKREIIERRDGLLRELDQVYRYAPRTSSKAYKRARTALKVNEEFTFSADEIDRFLPDELRMNEG